MDQFCPSSEIEVNYTITNRVCKDIFCLVFSNMVCIEFPLLNLENYVRLKGMILMICELVRYPQGQSPSEVRIFGTS